MGASISLDSKYRLILNTEVECISINTSSPKASGGGRSQKQRDHKDRKDRESDDASGSGSGSDSESGTGSESGSGSESESDGEKTYTVKLTPEIIGYIRSYIRKTQFLDEFDLITEIELDKYDHAPGSAIVFNSDSIVFMPNDQTLEAVGDWEYLESDKPVSSSSSSSSKSKSKSGGRKRHRHNADEDEDHDHASSKYKTKEDDLSVGEIENVLTEKFQEYNKTREFVIHESKNSFLVLLIKSVEVVKV